MNMSGSGGGNIWWGTYILQSMTKDCGTEVKRGNMSRSIASDQSTQLSMVLSISICALTPPEVGAADPSSAILIPTIKIKIDATSHPQTYPNPTPST